MHTQIDKLCAYQLKGLFELDNEPLFRAGRTGPIIKVLTNV